MEITVQQQASLAVTRLVIAGQSHEADKLSEVIRIAGAWPDVLRTAVRAAHGILARVGGLSK